MTAVILVAGRSMRMGELTAQRHKSLLPVAGHPILDWILNALDHNAIRRVVFVSGSMAEQLQDHVSANFPQLDVTWVHNPDFAETNTAYSVLLTESVVRRDEPMLLINGDVALDARAIARTLNGRGTREPVSVLATRFSGVADEEVKATVDDRGRVTEIGKHIPPEAAAGESIGINLLAPEHLDALYTTLRERVENGAGRTEYYEHAFNQMVAEGVAFRAWDVTDLPVMEVDTPEDYEAMKESIGPQLME